MHTNNTLEIINGQLLDCTGTPLRHADLRIKHDRIEAISAPGSRQNGDREPANRTIDAAGLTVMPGLIDAHVHISYGEGRTAEEVDVYGGPEWVALRAAWNAKKVLHAGVTSIIDPGGTYFVGCAVRDAINNGMFAGPRIFTAGRHITADGGFADYFPSILGLPASAEGVLCSTKADMLSEVRRQVKNRVDCIKLSGDSQAQETNGTAGPCFTDDEMCAVIGMAHQLGKKVTVHARYAKTITAMVKHGIDWVLHASHLPAEDMGIVRDANVALCPTMTFAHNIVEFGHECGSEPGHINFRKREIEGIVETYRRVYEAGIPIMAGTESGFSMCPYGEWHAKEIELLVSLIGMSPMAAIQAMTINNARAIGWNDHVGSLESGKVADILLVEGNPLDDVRILQDRARIRAVFKGGVEVLREPVATRPRLGHERGFAVSTHRLRRDAETLRPYASPM